MALVYLRHPQHGEMVESSEAMVGVAKANGWVEFDPNEGKVVLPAFFGTPLPEEFPARERLVDAGYATLESIPREAEALMEVNGIGNATALKVLDALEG